MTETRKVEESLRRICLALPGAVETVSFGHPTFRAGKNSFAVLETYKGELSICIRVGKAVQDIFLQDPRFYRTPYIGKHGWVSLRAGGGDLNWDEIAELVYGSHRLAVAPKRT